MKCPVCGVELKIADRQGVEIDYCVQCRGVWLDRGELDKLIERAALDLEPDVQEERLSARRRGERYRDDDRQDFDDDRVDRDDRYRRGSDRRRRGSFLDDVFDLFD